MVEHFALIVQIIAYAKMIVPFVKKNHLHRILNLNIGQIKMIYYRVMFLNQPIKNINSIVLIVMKSTKLIYSLYRTARGVPVPNITPKKII